MAGQRDVESEILRHDSCNWVFNQIVFEKMLFVEISQTNQLLQNIPPDRIEYSLEFYNKIFQFIL